MALSLIRATLWQLVAHATAERKTSERNSFSCFFLSVMDYPVSPSFRYMREILNPDKDWKFCDGQTTKAN
jgi:hypothetical protein